MRILYLREMRSAFREKTIVINSILIPIFLYPFLMWAAFTGLMFVMGQTEGFQSRVTVAEWPKSHPALRLKLEHHEQMELSEAKETPAASEQAIKEGRLDALMELLPTTNAAAALPGNFEARITYDQSRERSTEAQRRLTEIIDEYRGEWLKRDAKRRGVPAAAWQGFTVATRNVASTRQMGSFILGMVAPIIFVVMVAIGCFYPAVDATAGERERNTWETLMSSAASRLNIVTAKYLYVASLGGLAGILNLLAVMLTLKPIFAPLLAQTGRTLQFTIPLAAFPVTLVAAVLLAGFVAAGMMLFASFARTFKEGQAMITPFYMLVLIPVVFLQAPGLQFSLPLALVPIVNLTLMVREALSGVFHWLPMGIAFVVSLVAIGLCLRLATFILTFEDVVTGAYSGSLVKFLQQRVLKAAARKTAPSTR